MENRLRIETGRIDNELRQFQQNWSKIWQRWRRNPVASLDPLSMPDEEVTHMEYIVKDGIVKYLNSDDRTAEEMFKRARRIRDKNTGNKLNLRAAVDISNVCRVNCGYCPMRRDNLLRKNEFTTIPKRATAGQIIESANAAYNLGFRNLFLQSGEDMQILPIIEEAIIKILSSQPDWNIILNLGSLSLDQYKALKKAGAKGYLIKHETANPRLHQDYRGESLKHRVRHMLMAREAGFEAGSGNILGLPDQTDDDLADDIIFLGRFNSSKTVSCSPFTPSDELPEKFRHYPAGDFGKTKRFIALLRLCFPAARIPAVSNTDSPHISRASSSISGQSELIMAGANGLTVNFTPPEIEAYYGLYELGRTKPYLVGINKALRVSSETGLPLDLH